MRFVGGDLGVFCADGGHRRPQVIGAGQQLRSVRFPLRVCDLCPCFPGSEVLEANAGNGNIAIHHTLAGRCSQQLIIPGEEARFEPGDGRVFA